MKTAIVTGASSGIGLAVSRVLIADGIKVYGFGRNFSKLNPSAFFTTPDLFVPVHCDMADTRQLYETVNGIKKETKISLLVNNAGVGYFGLHEELNYHKIHEMVAVNLESPLLLTQLLLRDLKKEKGTIINISSITAKQSNPHGCAYGATKAGLTSFSLSLFDEARKYGIKVVTLHPDMTSSGFYRHANFSEYPSNDCFLLSEEIADAIHSVLSMREGMVITDLTIRPQKHRLIKKTSENEIPPH